MEVTFQLMPADLKAFQKLNRNLHPWMRIQGLIVGMSIATIFWSILFGATGPWQIAGIGALLIIVALRLFQFRRQNNTKPLLLHSLTIRISPDSLFIQEHNASTTRLWAGVIGIEANEQIICFLITKSLARIVPRRAFHNPELAQRFEETARAYWKGLPAPDSAPPADQWPPPPQIMA